MNISFCSWLSLSRENKVILSINVYTYSVYIYFYIVIFSSLLRVFAEFCRIFLMNVERQHSNPKYSVHIEIKIIKIYSVHVRVYDLDKPFLKMFGFPTVPTKKTCTWWKHFFFFLMEINYSKAFKWFIERQKETIPSHIL